MRSFRWAVLLLIAGATIGCRGKAMNIESPPADEALARQLQIKYQRVRPDTLVGLVVATRPEANLAAVTGVPVSEFKPGDILTFIDSKEQVLTAGEVVTAASRDLHVRYDPPRTGRREPRAGDLAVRIK